MKYSCALLILLFANTVMCAERQNAVPVRFIGEWNSKLKDCGTGLNDSRLRISSNKIRFYESAGPIRAVVTHGELELMLINELSGEGTTWLASSHFQLSADHTSLTDVSGDSKMVRYRCPAK